MGGETWEVVADGFSRLEAPCFDTAGRLCFSDIGDNSGIYRLGHDGRPEIVDRGRAHVGGLVPHIGGGLVATGAKVDLIEQGSGRTLLAATDGWGFNDLTTDEGGNVYVGMFGERPSAEPPTRSGSLWRIGTDGRVTCCYDGIKLTNGIRVSPDGANLYHADTLEHAVWVCDLTGDGDVTGRRVFFELPYGMPDGLAVDDVGGLWIAAVGAGVVFRVRPDGVLDFALELPVAYVSALCFGGTDNRTLFITTFGAPYDLEHSGSILSTRTAAAGLPVAPARV